MSAIMKLKRRSCFWIAPTGTSTTLSMLRNRKRPFFCSTPITSKRRPSIAISLPTGSTNGKSASTMSVPITVTGAPRSTSVRVRKRPFST